MVDSWHTENSFWAVNSASYCPINAKLGGKKQNYT